MVTYEADRRAFFLHVNGYHGEGFVGVCDTRDSVEDNWPSRGSAVLRTRLLPTRV